MPGLLKADVRFFRRQCRPEHGMALLWEDLWLSGLAGGSKSFDVTHRTGNRVPDGHKERTDERYC
ncbi:hypothetical protein GKA01_13720 [Gluconobacter kanchanaburiensis NBRC 103587]|uniref:Uncharacterized protein n=1 Tax=Gluconobacter kanchanaburiensis NBRC 103587 TaxID=1307948 RepID=A0A511B6T9_9PROT|nr:hypothetical protein AA103587_1295 [Gluconobacter kanchanaburiensis NBRC 103587]GEK96175.1 hypothetical protein GKA01_13720 [Gluconobacter kanchanaburiensis NBRC 103587]